MTSEIVLYSDNVLQHPFSCIIAGASQSGKSVFTLNLIKNIDTLIQPKITEIVLSYTEDQLLYNEIKNADSRVVLVKDLEYSITSKGNTLIVIDDQMNDVMKDKNIQDLFIKGVHHRSVSVILITQNLFPPGKYGRTIRLNATYLVIFKSLQFNSAVKTLGQQLFPSYKNFLYSAYQQATVSPYTYLFVNMHPNCEDKIRVRSGILPFEECVIYTPK